MNFIDLWVDCQRRRLVDASGSYSVEPPVFVRGDDVLLRIRFLDVDRAANPFVVTPRAFAGGTQFFLTGKAAFNGTVMVFSEDATAWNQAGDWAEADPAEGQCSCRANFNGSELLATIGATPEINIWFDIDVFALDGSVTTLWRYRMPVWNDVHRGNEGDPAPAAPTYPTTAELNARLEQGIELRIEGDQVAIYLNNIRRGVL
jgi:hypothetical protein